MSGKKTEKRMTAIDYVSDELMFDIRTSDLKPKKMVLKGGYGDWLLILTASKDGERVVAFVGSGSIQGVARKVHKQIIDGLLEWRPDKYAD